MPLPGSLALEHCKTILQSDCERSRRRTPQMPSTYTQAAAIETVFFSAFWLRSSVVSVLISLISDIPSIAGYDINLIFVRVDA